MSGELTEVSTEQLNAELLRRNCEQSGHWPNTMILDGAGLPLHSICECGRFRWKRESTDDGS